MNVFVHKYIIQKRMRKKRKSILIYVVITVIFVSFLLVLYIKSNMIPFYDETLTGTWIEKLDAKENSLEYNVAMAKYDDITKKLEHGENINRKDEKFGIAPLMIAASIMDEKESLKMCKFLIKNGADITIADKEGKNVLYYAVIESGYMNNKNLVKFLIKNGADVKQRMKTEDMEYSVTLPFYCIQECFQEIDNNIIQIFIENGYDANEKMENGKNLYDALEQISKKEENKEEKQKIKYLMNYLKK